jgi:hypothetical protein
MTIVDAYREMLASLNISIYREWAEWRKRVSQAQFREALCAHNIRPEQHKDRYIIRALTTGEDTSDERPSTETSICLHYPECSPIIRSEANFRVADAVICALEERIGLHHPEDDGQRIIYLRNRLREWEILRDERDGQHTSSTT